MRLLVFLSAAVLILSCGSSSGSSKTYVNPHAEAHGQMHQELYQEEVNKEITRRLEKLSGTYKGMLPCSDCDGIAFEVTLNSDLSYTSRASYLGQSGDPVLKEGSYSLSDEWKIKLDQNTGDLQHFQLEDGQLKVLDRNGLEIQGEQADKYVLQPSGN